MMNNYPYKSPQKDYSGDGLGLFGEALPDTIKIEHVFTLKISDKLERPLRKWVDKVLDLSKYYAESFQFIAVGIGSYFFLLGISKIVQANNMSSNSDDGSNTHSKKNKTKNSKNQKSKESVANTIGSEYSSRNAKTKDNDVATQLQQSSTIPKMTTAEVSLSDSERRATA